ncbi:hypothetical protein ONZ45_g299 [Pleurotus djamor]|nr:hypothetical protein ONZ45_g299 [Pleurotus djamor]
MPPPGLNLKQRLAALSLSPSSPSAYSGHFNHLPQTPQSPVTKVKALFNAPRMMGRRGQAESGPHQGTHVAAQGVLDEVIGKMIFQAGVDYETRPMVVMNASALPDPKEVNYDMLLSRILAYLDLYVESDYTVVFFASGAKHTPGWNWIWKAYRSLSRKYRKNLKRLYIVHSSFFSKSIVIFTCWGDHKVVVSLHTSLDIVVHPENSPKFFRKLEYANNLTELAYLVPITQIDIPPAVYQENSKHESQITLPTTTRSSMFGVPLEDMMGYDGEKGGIPRVVRDSIQFLRETGNVVSLHTFGDPHLAAVLIKKYLRDLPEPLFPESLYPVIWRCPFPTNENDIAPVLYIRETLLPHLIPCAYILLSTILHLMHDVSLRSQTNFMDAHNLAIVLGPNLVSGSNPLQDVMMCGVPGGPRMTSSPPSSPATPSAGERKNTLGLILKISIQRYYEIFDEVHDRSEALPPPRESAYNPSSSTPSQSSSVSGSPQPEHASYRYSYQDDEDIDDAMLVMPIGPASPRNANHGSPTPASPNNNNHAAPSAWGANNAPAPYKVRQRKPRNPQIDPSIGARSLYAGAAGDGRATNAGGSPRGLAPSTSKARSMISIEKGSTSGAGGSGVEAISITAPGFFTSPDNAPPVPKRTGL